MDVKEAIRTLHKKDVSIVLAITGGGTGAINELTKYGGASSTIQEVTVPYGKTASIKYVGSEPEQYCSRNHALNLAMESYRRARTYTERMQPALGVGSCAKLKINGERKGRTNEIWVATQTDEETRVMQLVLQSEHTREEQERLSSMVIVDAVLQAQGIFNDKPFYEPYKYSNEHMFIMIQRGCEKILEVFQEKKFVNIIQGNNVANPIVFPGSFDPMHDAHIEIARAAFDFYGKSRYVVLELCIKNPDKPSIDLLRLQERIEQINKRVKNEEWFGGIAVSNTPLFIDKAVAMNKTTFVVGKDTFDRIFSLKYSNLYSQDDFKRHNVHFLVFDRKIGTMPYDHVDKLLYTMIPESFYSDKGVSSSAIRKIQNGNNV